MRGCALLTFDENLIKVPPSWTSFFLLAALRHSPSKRGKRDSIKKIEATEATTGSSSSAAMAMASQQAGSNGKSIRR